MLTGKQSKLKQALVLVTIQMGKLPSGCFLPVRLILQGQRPLELESTTLTYRHHFSSWIPGRGRE
jgi:hypothetical protein